jgi:hypothetical protein
MAKAIWIAALSACFVTGSALADQPAGGGGGTAPAAAPEKAPEKAPKKAKGKGEYGTAGCGLGSMIFGPGDGFVQVFAATTNDSFYSQLYGISSGTSNCRDSDSGDDSARVFVEGNREALAKDISRGSGETVDNLAAIAGCADSKAVGATLKRNFKVIFPNASVSSEDVTDHILSTLKSDSSLQCSAISG